ncbi:MAG: Spi family protease inhibitor, partial [Bacteroidaceae bacterium]|nr:Spi family protease inhibitor [Bacteroidaceae bacterium]
MKNLYLFFVALCSFASLSLSAQTIAPQLALERAKTIAKTSVMNSQELPDYQLAKTFEVEGAPAMYLYIPVSGEGFLLVAAEEGARAVLGVSDKGRIDVANLPAPLQSWIDVYAREIAAKRATAKRITIKYESRATIAPICKTQWGM